MGPLTMEARLYGVETVWRIQDEINAAARTAGRPEIVLMTDEERSYIEELWFRNVWPQGWTGTEQRADELHSYVVADGVEQPTLPRL